MLHTRDFQGPGTRGQCARGPHQDRHPAAYPDRSAEHLVGEEPTEHGRARRVTPKQARRSGIRSFRCDRAVFAPRCLTAIRVAALVSLRAEHVNLSELSVTQNPRALATRIGKNIDTFFAPGFDEAETAMRVWLTPLDEVEFYIRSRARPRRRIVGKINWRNVRQ